MSDQKKALGKGLSSLIPMGGNRADSGGKNYFECPISDIIPNPNQPRKLFARESIDELAASIEEKGILQPLIVRKIGGGKYEIVAGERRFRAASQLGLEKVAVVVKDIEESEVLELALIENIQRQDLNPVEEALAYKELLTKHQYTQDELAKRLGKDRSTIANALRLLKLPESIRIHLINNEISMGHARALLAIENKELQTQIAEDIVKNGLSVREVEDLTRKLRDGEITETAAKEEASNPAAREAQETPPRFLSIITRMKDHLRKHVALKLKGGKGQIVLSFNDEAEFNEIAEKLLS
jgi:ParB family chromosome partitioning protein